MLLSNFSVPVPFFFLAYVEILILIFFNVFQVVHVVDTTGTFEGKRDISSYVSLFSTTPGKLNKEVEQIKEGLNCGRDKVVDFVAFSVKYGCWTYDDTEDGWSESDIPLLHVFRDVKKKARITRVSVDTKGSIRWVLAVNTEEIEDFSFEGTMNFNQRAFFIPIDFIFPFIHAVCFERGIVILQTFIFSEHLVDNEFCCQWGYVVDVFLKSNPLV